MKRLLLSLTLVAGLSGQALAVNPDEKLADPAQEERARHLSKELRCLVCQNQSIDDSDAQLAKDLRIVLRERITAGDSDEQIFKFLTDRYGEYVLLRPPLRAGTLVLWIGPVLLLIAGGLAAFLFYRRQRSEVPETVAAPLSEEERKRLERILREDQSQ